MDLLEQTKLTIIKVVLLYSREYANDWTINTLQLLVLNRTGNIAAGNYAITIYNQLVLEQMR